MMKEIFLSLISIVLHGIDLIMKRAAKWRFLNGKCAVISSTLYRMQTHHVMMSWTIFNFYRTLRNVFELDGAVEPSRGRSDNFVWRGIVHTYINHIIIKSSEPLSPDHSPRDARISSAVRCRARLARTLCRRPFDAVKCKTQINTLHFYDYDWRGFSINCRRHEIVATAVWGTFMLRTFPVSQIDHHIISEFRYCSRVH